MIQPLRTVHRRASIALALILPTVLLVGLMARRPPLQADSKRHNSEGWQSIQESDHLWTKRSIRSLFVRNTSDPTAVHVVLEPIDDLSDPDLLVYWSPELSGRDNLPTNAVLLGAFEDSRPMRLQGSDNQGFLILYSLAHHSVVDTAPLGRVL